MNDDVMTIEEWNDTRMWVDEYIQYLDEKDRQKETLEPKTELEILLEKCADDLYSYSKRIEPGITNDIRMLANVTSGNLLGNVDSETGLVNPSHVLKEKTSIKRKIIDDSDAYEGDYLLASKNIRDAVRYTVIYEDDKYIESVDNFLHMLEEMGYYDIEVKNNWGTPVCQGINVKLKHKEGNFFEIQFHTPYGHHVKEECTRKLYRVIRDEDADSRLKFLANKLRKILQSSVKAPVGAIEYQFVSNVKRR